jgi:hypothetical protein
VKTSTADPREVSELEIWERSTCGAEGPGAHTINVETSMMGPWEVSELKVQERPPST